MELPRPEYSVRSEIYVDKRKLILCNIGIFLASYLIVPVLLESQSKDQMLMVIALSVFYSIVFVGPLWMYFSGMPRLRIYENGLEIKNLGFWLWGDVLKVCVGRELEILLNTQDNIIKKKSKNSSVNYYSFDKASHTLTLKYKFPFYLTNVSLESFYETLSRCYKNKTDDSQNEGELSKIYINSRFKRYRIINRINCWFYWSLFVSSLFVFSIIYPTFFPSLQYREIHLFFASWSAIIITLCYLYLIIRGNPNLFPKRQRNFIKKHKVGKYFILLLYPFWGCFLSYTVLLSVGHIYTIVYGTNMDISVFVRPEKSYNGKLCFESEELGTGLFKYICAENNDYDDHFPENLTLRLHGKKSEFGFVYDKYSLNDKVQH